MVGAGAAGLTATSILAERGVDVVCLEARDRTGGRLLSVQSDGGALDLGATWFWPGERRVEQLVGLHELAVFDQHLDGAGVYDGPDGVVRMVGNPIDAPSCRYGAGAASLTDALTAQLPAGTVRLGEAVAGIDVDGDELVVSTTSGRISARQVIVAVPPALAVERIAFTPGLPGQVLAIAGETPVWMGVVTKVVARYAEPFWRDRGLAGAVFSAVGPLREIHDMSGPQGSPAALFGFTPGGGVYPSSALVQLARVFGPKAADPVELFVQDWSREQWTSPAAVARLTDYSRFGHPLFAQPVLGGRMHWASTETATEAAGHVEGALASGERAATAVLDALTRAQTR